MPHPEFVEDVLGIIERIPDGRVMTYGDIAHALGVRSARQVGQVLSHYGHQAAWWRVVPVSGDPPRGHADAALPHYTAEETPLKTGVGTAGYRINLSAARLPFSHDIYEGALARHAESAEDPERWEHPLSEANREHAHAPYPAD